MVSFISIGINILYMFNDKFLRDDYIISCFYPCAWRWINSAKIKYIPPREGQTWERISTPWSSSGDFCSQTRSTLLWTGSYHLGVGSRRIITVYLQSLNYVAVADIVKCVYMYLQFWSNFICQWVLVFFFPYSQNFN